MVTSDTLPRARINLSRAALAERTGGSRSTVARILDDWESRGWIVSGGSRYDPTDRGLAVVRDADEYRGLTRTALPSDVAALGEGLVRGRLDVEGVIEAGVFETLRGDRARTRPWNDIPQGAWVDESRRARGWTTGTFRSTGTSSIGGS
jgi:DNA-binding transcriptional MocR family regulator